MPNTVRKTMEPTVNTATCEVCGKELSDPNGLEIVTPEGRRAWIGTCSPECELSYANDYIERLLTVVEPFVKRWGGRLYYAGRQLVEVYNERAEIPVDIGQYDPPEQEPPEDKRPFWARLLGIKKG